VTPLASVESESSSFFTVFNGFRFKLLLAFTLPVFALTVLIELAVLLGAPYWVATSLYEMEREQITHILLVSLAGTALAILAAIFVSRRMTQPLQDMAMAAQKGEAGDFCVRAAAGGARDTSRVSDAFNSMMVRVQHWHETLENEVAAGTQQLAEQHERVQRYLDIAGVMFIALDADGNVVLANKKACEILGCEESHVVGKNWFHHFVPKRLRAEVEQVFLRLMAGDLEPVEHYENPVVSSSGEERIIAWHNALLTDQSGHVIGTLSSGQDITAQKQAYEALIASEQKYRTLFELLSEAVFLVHPNGIVLDANRAASDLLGAPRSEIIGADVLPFYWNPSDRQEFKRRLYKEGFLRDFEWTVKRKDGVQRACVMNSRLWKDRDGNMVAHVTAARDVTEARSLQRQLLHAQKMEAIGTLAGGIAHDFNNLLTVILGFSDLLLADKTPDHPEYEDLQKIAHAARNGRDLVQRILTLSRKAESKPRPLDLNRGLRNAEDLLRRTLPRIIDIELILETSLRAVNADPGQIEQVLLNLVVNSKDAMPDGGKLVIETENITLDEEYSRAHVDVKAGDYVLLTISDTGEGMSKETLQHVFEPFFTTKTSGAGTGLGLAIVYGIVRQHNGHINCYSEPRQGTTFKIYLPVFTTSEQTDVPRALEVPLGGQETILLVDDEEHIRELCKRSLSQAGYTILTANDGQEALELYREKAVEIDLVVLDLIMPIMEGHKCFEELRKIDPAVKVIIASGYSAHGPAKRAVEAGARGFIRKPYNLSELLGSVRQVLDEGE
jgi:two-component system cell cycle sensor histidine kinase/response regulator CckA